MHEFVGVRSAGEAEYQQNGSEHYDDADFDHGGDVVEVGAFARSPDVDSRDDGDHQHDYYGRLHLSERNNFLKIAGEGVRQGRDCAAGNDKEKAPTVEKSGEASEAIADVAIQAACFGIGCGKFGVGECAEQREDAAG